MPNLPVLPLAEETTTTTSSGLIEGVPNDLLMVGIAAVAVILVVWMLTRPRG